MDGVWATKSEAVVLIVRAVSFQDFQPMWSQSTNVTDRQTDRQTSYDLNTVLHTIVHRAVERSPLNVTVTDDSIKTTECSNTDLVNRAADPSLTESILIMTPRLASSLTRCPHFFLVQRVRHGQTLSETPAVRRTHHLVTMCTCLYSVQKRK